MSKEKFIIDCINAENSFLKKYGHEILSDLTPEGFESNSLTNVREKYGDLYEAIVKNIIIKNNYGACSDPSKNDDSEHGYSIGSEWINIENKILWKCLGASIGEAIWRSQI